MPSLRTYRVFISHCWDYDADYHHLAKWLDEEPLFKWRDLSVSEANALPGDTKLESRLRKRLSSADVLLVIAGMEIPHRHWMNWEIKWARIRSVPIVAVMPNGAKKIPTAVKEVGCPIVGWRRASVVGAIREYALR